MVWMSLLVFRSKTRTFEFSSAVTNSRLPCDVRGQVVEISVVKLGQRRRVQEL